MERYESWNPIEETDCELFIVWFENRPSTGVVLELEAKAQDRILRIYFDDALAFRQHPHDILMRKYWGSGSSLYRVIDSDWVKWLATETQQIYSGPYLHFGIRTIDGCYEVLTCTQPRAEWVQIADSLNPEARSC